MPIKFWNIAEQDYDLAKYVVQTKEKTGYPCCTA